MARTKMTKKRKSSEADKMKKIERIFSDAQNSLVLQQSDLSLETISNMIESGAINIEPKYQRRERWSIERQSALIESFLLNIPVPPIYLAEDEYGTYSIIDGKQRLTAIYQFMNNKFKLVELETFDSIEGFYLKDLPNAPVNALKIRPYLRVVTLLKQSDKKLKYEVFLRLNKGGISLTNQEIRNVAYRGHLNDLLFKLAENEHLMKMLKIKNKTEKPYKEMLDVEYVLRFFTLKDSWKNFNGNMSLSMDQFMEAHYRLGKKDVIPFKKSFLSAIKRCEDLFGDKSFQAYSRKSGWRNQMILGMYDAQMVAVSNLTKAQYQNAVRNKGEIENKVIEELIEDDLFDSSIRQFTTNPDRMKYRILKIIKILRSL